MSDVVIRPATTANVERIAIIHVQAWRETYRGLLPDAMLARLSIEQRMRAWSDIERAPAIIVAEEGGVVVGFGSASMARDPLLGTDGEVTSIYLLDQHKRHGIGRRFFAHLLTQLAERGCTSAGLWVLDTNMGARRFYEAIGGRTGPIRLDERQDVALN
ncbi:MAG: GNAT family N-acetyltransferase [Rhizobiales bacterium]|nr:GNAT family N-acetyltransferase [Hyphomicrobiales bacterium]